MSNSMFICLSLLAVISVSGGIAFAKSLSPTHAMMTAFAYLREQLGDDEAQYEYDKRPQLLCMTNLVETNYALVCGKHFERAEQKRAWLVKEAEEIQLTPRQQLMLLDSLLNLNTRPEQAKKIVKVRSTKEIVDLAAQYASDNRRIEAPLALFR